MFISAFGDENSTDREIAFAHFHQESGDLPTLRVLGWDGGNTALTIASVDHTLREKLHWPEKGESEEQWRERWNGAFRHRIGHRIRTADSLAEILALLARGIRDRAKTMLGAESERGSLTKLYKAFQTALIHDLTPATFADTYAQTITYGLLTAAISRTEMSLGARGTALIAENVADIVPVTNPFLKEMLQTFLKVGGRRGGIDFDELGIQDVVELLRGDETDLPSVIKEFGHKNPDKDTVIYFYENFLSAYDHEQKVKRGIFYTPPAVVSYIVRSVHELLQTEFGLEDGLASTVTWSEMQRRNPGLALPKIRVRKAGDSLGEEKEIHADSPFVQILDPATGTATFLVEVIDLIHLTLTAKWKKDGLNDKLRQTAWNEYVPKHLLPRLHGYELMMAPYAIAHMKIGLKLYETGYRFRTEERARIYLTNALEPAHEVSDQLESLAPALAHEAKAVNDIKRYQRFTVVVGNPPYAGVSTNMSEAASALIEPYKFVDGIPLGERKHWLQDDYVKFTRLAQMAVEVTGTGILGYITNHGYLDNPTFRGMRQNLMRSFSDIRVLDLHGNVKKRDEISSSKRDENVFDIEQGVAIGVFHRPLNPSDSTCVRHAELLGPRVEKYQWLTEHTLVTQNQLSPSSPYYFFVKREETHRQEYEALIPVTSIFQIWSTGVQTSRDSFAIAPTHHELEERLKEFLAPSITDEELKEAYGLKDMSFWRVAEVRRDFRLIANPNSCIKPIDYRPFDTQFVVFNEMIIHRPKVKVMRHMLAGENLALLLPRQLAGEIFHHAFCTRSLAEMCVISTKTTEQNNLFPLYLYNNEGDLGFSVGDTKKNNLARSPNIAPGFVKMLVGRLKSEVSSGKQPPFALSSEDIFHYAYAILHSPDYRTRYAEFLKIEFPRLPLTGNLELFKELARLGGELTALHLLESPKLGHPLTRFIGNKNPVVEKPTWSKNTVWLDKAQTTGFEGVTEAVWNFHIGGYQVCAKWLKDRKSRPLTDDDIAHYHKIVVALSETIRLMAEIDKVIEAHGGWPGAFSNE